MKDGAKDAGRTEPLGVAVVGAGYWGPNLVRNFQSSPQFRLRWLCDLDVDRARQVLGGYSTVQATSDYAAVLADPAVDAVAVATPAGTHLEVALAALRVGKHVLVEKPLAATYEDGLRLVNEAEERGLTLMCDHTYCYTCGGGPHPGDGPLRRARRDPLRGLGTDQPGARPEGRRRPVGSGPHDLSVLDFILPDHVRPVAVAAHGADPIGAGQSCVAYLTLQLSTGAIAHVHVNWLSPTKVRTTMVGGSKRTLVWDDLNPSQRVAVFDRGVELSAPQEIGADERRDMLVSYRTGDMVAPAIGEKEALRSMVEEFAAAISTGRPAAHRRPGRAAGAGHPRSGLPEPGVPRRGRRSAHRALTVRRLFRAVRGPFRRPFAGRPRAVGRHARALAGRPRPSRAVSHAGPRPIDSVGAGR